MAGTKAAGEVAVFPGIVEMIVRIGGAGIMAHPLFTIDVRGCGMAGLVTEVVLRFISVRSPVERSRPMRRRSMWRSMLRKCRNGDGEQEG
jgi:hypothetical protein